MTKRRKAEPEKINEVDTPPRTRATGPYYSAFGLYPPGLLAAAQLLPAAVVSVAVNPGPPENASPAPNLKRPRALVRFAAAAVAATEPAAQP